VKQGELGRTERGHSPQLCLPHTPDGGFKGQEGLAQAITMYRTAMPDLNITIDDMAAEGDKLACPWTLVGTFTGEPMGIAPTGKRCTMTGAIFVYYVDGKEVEAMGFNDQR
jgi:predicted ester cyclase